MLSDEELQNIVGRRLGYDLAIHHECSGCGAEVDPTATHGLSCKMSKGRHSQHSEVNSSISRALSSAGFSAKLDPSGHSCTDGCKPVCITQVQWLQGLPLVWDFTCVNTFAPSHVCTGTLSAAIGAE